MCNESKLHVPCLCHRIFGVIKLITAGAILGSIAGMVAMYFFDRDKWMQCRAKKILQSAESFTRNIQSKIDSSETHEI